MEGEADLAAARARLAQHRRGFVRLRAELRGEVIEGALDRGGVIRTMMVTPSLPSVSSSTFTSSSM